jgi:hypothetical protein
MYVNTRAEGFLRVLRAGGAAIIRSEKHLLGDGRVENPSIAGIRVAVAVRDNAIPFAPQHPAAVHGCAD